MIAAGLLQPVKEIAIALDLMTKEDDETENQEA
jgi:hypothetical protein